MNHDNLLFYDIEVYKFDSLVVIKNFDNEFIYTAWSLRPEEITEGRNGFEDIYNVVTDSILVGFNNHNYDDWIISKMMHGSSQAQIKKANDTIISGFKLGDDVRHRVSEMKTLDCMQEIDPSRPSLKKIEGNMGRSIIETSIPFNIDRPLTDEEREEVFKYCSYDVESTIEVFKLREKSYFDVREQLLEMLDESIRKKAYRWNTTVIAANILLKGNPLRPWTNFISHLPEGMFHSVDGIPESVWDMWESVNTKTEPSQKTKKVVLFDTEFTFAFGGLHGVGVHSSCHPYTNVKLLDVGSMYPSIVKVLNALDSSTDLYDSLRIQRLSCKKTDPVKADALKLVLNSVYGNFKSDYSLLRNPKASVAVCIYGQMALFELCRMLHESGYEIINANTDGVAFTEKMVIREWEDVQEEWESKWKLYLDLDEFDYWYQKDVNNYIATHNGKIKVKGGETKGYDQDWFFKNNNARIVPIAIVEKIVNKKSPLDTILENLENPKLFQYILKAGNTYKGTFDQNNVEYNKVNRIFASKPRDDTVKLFKMREDGGKVNFPDMPDQMWVVNSEVKDLEEFHDRIDINHYYKVICKKLEGWDVN